jgi:hypothetical protein
MALVYYLYRNTIIHRKDAKDAEKIFIKNNQIPLRLCGEFILYGSTLLKPIS